MQPGPPLPACMYGLAALFLGQSPPPGGEAHSNMALVMPVSPFIHPKP